jgi:hypothetical protein
MCSRTLISSIRVPSLLCPKPYPAGIGCKLPWKRQFLGFLVKLLELSGLDDDYQKQEKLV